jgi:hypothetical protein
MMCVKSLRVFLRVFRNGLSVDNSFCCKKRVVDRLLRSSNHTVRDIHNIIIIIIILLL